MGGGIDAGYPVEMMPDDQEEDSAQGQEEDQD
jgi:hypothetical protein